MGRTCRGVVCPLHFNARGARDVRVVLPLGLICACGFGTSDSLETGPAQASIVLLHSLLLVTVGPSLDCAQMRQLESRVSVCMGWGGGMDAGWCS